MSEADERHRQSTASRAASRQRDAALDAAMAHHPAGKKIVGSNVRDADVFDYLGSGQSRATNLARNLKDVDDSQEVSRINSAMRDAERIIRAGILVPAEHFPTLAALLDHAERWRTEWDEFIRPAELETGTSTSAEIAERDKEFDEVAGLITYIRGQQD